MLCYRDMTFCPFWESCRKMADCGRALTPDIVERAHLAKMDISQYADKPECYKPKDGEK